MRAYNVEIYDRHLVYRSHTNVMSIDYAEDYLSPETNSIVMEKLDAEVGDFIRLDNGNLDFFGIVSGVTSDSKDTMIVSYKSILSLFDLDILFDTNLQRSEAKTLELYISDTIQENFDRNSDSSMNLPHIVCDQVSTTSKWNFGLVSDEEGSHYCITNFLKKIIIPAFERYSIKITPRLNVGNRTIYLTVGVNEYSTVTMEADLPNILKKNVIVKQHDGFVNKVVIYNLENYTDKVIYYRHPDDTISVVDEDRIVPVVQEMYAVAPVYEDEYVVETFEECALDQALDAFSVVEYNHLIELTMAVDDELYHPLDLEIGQIVNVISDDQQYVSILSGRTINNSITLIFGKIRVDLTKQIWRSSYGY